MWIPALFAYAISRLPFVAEHRLYSACRDEFGKDARQICRRRAASRLGVAFLPARRADDRRAPRGRRRIMSCSGKSYSSPRSGRGTPECPVKPPPPGSLRSLYQAELIAAITAAALFGGTPKM